MLGDAPWIHRPLAGSERHDLYDTFRRIGEALLIPELAAGHAEWRLDRERHLARDLAVSRYTSALYSSYRWRLGPLRYALLLQLQGALAPERVRALLRLPRHPWIGAALRLVHSSRTSRCGRWPRSRSFRPG